MSEDSRMQQTCYRLIRGMRRLAWPIIVLSLVLAVASIYYTYRNLTFHTSRGDLVASNQKLIARSEKIDQEFGSHDDLVVVVENGHPQSSIAFAEALAAELRRYPQAFKEIFYRLNPEQFKQWALLYTDTKDLEKLKKNLLENRRVMESLAAHPDLAGFFRVINAEITRSMIGHLFTGFLEEGPAAEKLPDLSFLDATLKELSRQLSGDTTYISPFKSLFPGDISDLSQEGYMFTENDKYLLFLVTPAEGDFAARVHSVDLLRQLVAKVEARFPNVKAGVTGPAALDADEMTEALKDVSLATWLSLLGQLILLIIFMRSLKRPLMESLILVIGLCWVLGMATLVVGHLNLLSVVFAPLILGITIDYGVHLFARLEEEQEEPGHCTIEAVGCTLRRAAPGIIYAAVAAALSFLPLVFTGFKGLEELGKILTLGMLLMLVPTLLLLPALVLVGERCKPAQKPHECGHPRPFLALAWKRPGVIAALGALLMVLGCLSLSKVPLDLNPLHLQNPNAESVVWELRLLKNSRYSTSYGEMVAATLPELKEKIKELKKLPTVSHAESVLSFFPSEVTAKERLLRGLAPVVSGINFPSAPASPSSISNLTAVLGRIHFKLAQALGNLEPHETSATKKQIEEADSYLSRIIPLLNLQRHPETEPRLAAFELRFFQDLHEKWDLLLKNLHASPPGLQDLPSQIKSRFISSQGDYLVRIFPAQDIWDQKPLHLFVKDLRKVDPEVVGDPILLHHFNRAFARACVLAAGAALAIIIVMLILLFRSWKTALLALIPLFVGTGLTLNLMWLLDIPFNQANVLFLPLILGEGIEFGIIILTRWRREESAREITLPASTAKGVALAALTTTVGFGSLMVSGHRGVFSLGLLATVGSLSVLLASLSVLPAVLRLVSRKKEETSPSLLQYFSIERMLHYLSRWKETP